MRNAKRNISLLAACALFTTALPASADTSATTANAAVYSAAQPGFIANAGQLDGPAVLYTRTPDCAAYFEPQAVLFDRPPTAADGRGIAVRVSFPASAGQARLEAAVPRRACVNVVRGSDPSQWRTGLATYGEVRYHAIAPGADLVYRLAEGRLKYDVELAAGVSPGRAVLRYEGTERLELDAQGGLLIHTAVGTLYEQPPVLYQEVGGMRVPVRGGYRIAGQRDLSFWAAGYDERQPLVVDPGIRWSTYLGGSGVDYGMSLTADASGNLIVVGSTTSSNMPTTAGAYQRTKLALDDAFVAKLSSDGRTLLWATLLGGAGADYAQRVALDGNGNIYLAGGTGSSDFPTTAGAFQRSYGGGSYDVFVAKLSANGGSLLYASYLGGSLDEMPYGVALDGSGNLVVGGYSGSTNFPTTAGVVKSLISRSFANTTDGFVAKFNAAGSALLYCTFVGSNQSDDVVCALALDASGRAVVVGYTSAPDFPTTAGAVDRTYSAGLEAFVAKLNDNASAYVFSTYLGGIGSERARAVALDGSGSVYVAGGTTSSDFPTTAGAFQRTVNSSTWDGFVARLTADGSALLYCTALGGNAADECTGLALRSDGVAVVTGVAQSTNFPTTSGAARSSNAGGYDAFATALTANGAGLLYSTYLGGSGTDWGSAVALTVSGNVVVTGYTDSGAFPTTAGAHDVSINSSGAGAYDVFVTALDVGLSPPSTTGVGDGVSGTLGELTTAPNPFRSTTAISLVLARPTQVGVRIFDMQGRLVREFARLDLGAGSRSLTWDGRDSAGREVSPGRYIVAVTSDAGRSVAPVVRLR
jgi:hypothetical protein